MNKIFSVIWNVMTQTWAVVSELTRAHTKRASATVATAVLATQLSATAEANSSASVTSRLNVYGDTNTKFNAANNSIADLNKQNDGVHDGLLNLNENGANKKLLVDDNTAATVGDLRKLGWVVSTKNGKENEKSQQVKQADEVLFKGSKGGVQVTSTSENGKHAITFALAKDLDMRTATVSDTLTIGGSTTTGSATTPKVNVTSTASGLNFAKGATGANGDTTVHLTNIASTLQDTLLNTGVVSKLDGNGITADEKKRAASVQDVLNSGWNIKGVKTGATTSDNVDFVRTYDTVEFLSGSEETTLVTVDSESNGKSTKVKIGAKTSVIKEKDGKLFTGKANKDTNQVASNNAADDTDEGKGLVTAETVINAVNKAGWRIKTTGANNQAGQFETVTSGTNVTFADGNGTTAVVTGDATNGITVKYEAKVGDGLKIGNDQKITADTTALTVTGGKVTAPDATNGKKLVNTSGLADALNKLSWTAKAEADTANGGELDGTADEKEVKAGETVTFKAGKNLKVKQDGANFTYSLQDALTGLTSITLGTGNNGAKTEINKDGLTITPANGAGANNANTISVTKDGISAGGQSVKNVVSGLKKFGDANFDPLTT